MNSQETQVASLVAKCERIRKKNLQNKQEIKKLKQEKEASRIVLAGFLKTIRELTKKNEDLMSIPELCAKIEIGSPIPDEWFRSH